MGQTQKYDSRKDTRRHISRVNELVSKFTKRLLEKVKLHDRSKLRSPEKKYFDIYTPKLKGLTYGSKEYKDSLAQLQVALKHHYKHNSHHPEHYKNGIDGMDLFDIVELFFDWKSATERHADGNIYKSIKHNKDRFKMSDQLVHIFENTAKTLRYKK